VSVQKYTSYGLKVSDLNSKSEYNFVTGVTIVHQENFMERRKSPKKQDKYNLMVLKLLKELSKTPNARLSIREISRLLNINAMAVSRAINQLKGVIDIKKGSEFENFRLQVYLVRLKEGLEQLPITELLKRVKLSKRLNEEYYRR